MKIVFASAHPYLPQIAGGSQSNTHEMVHELLARGHEIGVLAGLTSDGWIGARGRMMMKLWRRKAIADRSQGYRVYRSWFAWEGARDVLRSMAPDIVVAQSGKILRVAKAFREIGVPTVIYLHNVEFEDHGEPIDAFRDSVFVANSQFTADRYQDAYGVSSTVINPLFQPERYRVQSKRERILFVNPHPLKGVDTAIALARSCPDIPFDFVESWTLSEDQRSALMQELASLSNVTLHPRTDDMRVHYGRARVVLVPSRWEETWGRIASEAHYSGIPVLATKVGGLSEAVGPGGILLSPRAEATEWTTALRRLWDDPALYESLSRAASNYAERPQLDRGRQIDQMESILAKAVA